MSQQERNSQSSGQSWPSEPGTNGTDGRTPALADPKQFGYCTATKHKGWPMHEHLWACRCWKPEKANHELAKGQNCKPAGEESHRQ